MPDELGRPAGLVRIRNDAGAAVAELIGRPSPPGNIGEYFAAKVFAIQLMTSGSYPGHDGVFTAALPGWSRDIRLNDLASYCGADPAALAHACG